VYKVKHVLHAVGKYQELRCCIAGFPLLVLQLHVKSAFTDQSDYLGLQDNV